MALSPMFSGECTVASVGLAQIVFDQVVRPLQDFHVFFQESFPGLVAFLLIGIPGELGKIGICLLLGRADSRVVDDRRVAGLEGIIVH